MRDSIKLGLVKFAEFAVPTALATVAVVVPEITGFSNWLGKHAYNLLNHSAIYWTARVGIDAILGAYSLQGGRAINEFYLEPLQKRLEGKTSNP